MEEEIGKADYHRFFDRLSVELERTRRNSEPFERKRRLPGQWGGVPWKVQGQESSAGAVQIWSRFAQLGQSQTRVQGCQRKTHDLERGF